LRVEGLLERGEVEVQVLRESEESEVVGSAHAVVRLPVAGFGCGRTLGKC
jgi:hypothetical protein